MKTVVGLFDDYAAAEAASAALQSAGFARDDISMLATEQARNMGLGSEGAPSTRDAKGKAAATGAGIGAAVGGVGGLLVSAGVLAIPGVGPVVAAGPILAMLAGAGIGAAAGGLIGALTKVGVPNEHADFYAEGVRRGGTLVMVRASDARAQEAADLLEGYGAIDVDERAGQWRKAGYTAHQPSAPAYSADEIRRERAAIPVVQEQLEIGKRAVTTGAVRVYAHVIEQPITEQVALREEHVVVERHPVDRAATPGEASAFRDQTIELTEHGERPVVQKVAKVVEEVTVGKRVDERVETVRDTVKRTDVDVQRTGGERTTGRWTASAADFRSDFDRRYAASGASWDEYEPAYRYGYGLSDDARYGTREWDAIERDVQTDWERQRPGTWDRVKDAIRFSWQRARGRTAPRMDERRI